MEGVVGINRVVVVNRDLRFPKYAIRLSSIVRQRIGIDRTLVISIIKYLVTVIRLKKKKRFFDSWWHSEKKSRWYR